VSRGFHLVTRERPLRDVFLDALREATGQATAPQIDGDFEDPNDYLNVSGPHLWIEAQVPVAPRDEWPHSRASLRR